LDLSENPNLENFSDAIAKNCPNLEKLALTGINTIRDVAVLAPLVSFDNLILNSWIVELSLCLLDYG
jgi:hypothetical protein